MLRQEINRLNTIVNPKLYYNEFTIYQSTYKDIVKFNIRIYDEC